MTFHHSFRNGYNTNVIAARHAEDSLTLDQVRRVVPSIWADEAHESRSERYVYIPSAPIVEGLVNNGWRIMSAMQARTRDPGRAAYTRHMLRLRHPDAGSHQGAAFEMVLRNAHDGSAAWDLLAGVLRFVCMNGMVVGDQVEHIKVYHKGSPAQIRDQVLDGSFRMLEHADEVLGTVDSWRGVQTTRDTRQAFADAAHTLRFGVVQEDGTVQVKTNVKPAQLLLPRRSADTGSDLWSVASVVQENVIRGGLHARGQNEAGQWRNSTTRPVQGDRQNVLLNQAIWQLSQHFAQLSRSAA